MTATVLTRGAGDQPFAGRRVTRVAGSAWRFAARLARREVRRRPGRTLLVMLLVAVPVCGMTVITVLVRTNNDSASEAFARRFGRADLALDSGFVAQTAGATTAPTPSFPAGTQVLRARVLVSPIGLASATGTARRADQVTDLDFTDPMTRGIVSLRSGRFPRVAGEALLSPKLATAFHVKIGDTLRLSAPEWTERIVGIGVRATNWNDAVVAVRGSELTAPAMQAVTTSLTLVKLPGHPSDTELLRYAPPYLSRAAVPTRTPDRAVNWILVAGMVALAIAGIVISGAFAVGARRQLVTLGQLSANGADESLLRRTLSLQGVISGALGSALGFGAGVVVLLLLRGHFSSWIHHDPGAYVWSARDTAAVLVTGVAAATIAAFIPARSAARVPVLSALAGRRPLGTLPRRLAPIGAGLFASGVFVLVLVASAANSGSSDGRALSAVFGGLLVLAGACCAASIVIAALTPVARAVHGAARVAVRSVVRSRARSAAVVMALAAVNAGAIGIGTAAESHTGSKTFDAPFMPNDTLIVSSSNLADTTTRGFLPPPASVQRTLHEILPASTWNVRRAVLNDGDGSASLPPKALKGLSIAPGDPQIAVPLFTVADPAVLTMLGLSAHDRAALASSGAISVHDKPTNQLTGVPLTSTQVSIGTGAARQSIAVAVARDAVRATGADGGYYITADKAHSLGLPIVDAGVIIHNPRPLDESQAASIDVLSQSLFVEGRAAGTVTDIAWTGLSGSRISEKTIEQIVLGVAVLIALIVLAMSLALSAAETRDERDVLLSLGARPSTMRAVSAYKAALLSAAGAIVAIPTGFIPVAVVFMAVTRSDQVAHVGFPWWTMFELVVLAPLLAAVVAYAGSAVAQAARPTRMSTFATD